MADVADAQRILVVALGSRGDVQPYIALGVGLRHAGYRVRLLTSADFVPIVQGMDLEAVDVLHGNMEEMIRANPDLAESMATGNVLKWLEAHGKSNAKFFPECFKSFLAEMKSFQPHLLLYGIMECWHLPAVAASMNVPSLFAGLTCLQPSAQIPTVCGEPDWVGGRIRLALATLMAHAFIKGNSDVMRPTIAELCPEACQYLPRLDGFMLFTFNSNLPSMFGVSPTLRPRPPDWPDTYHPTMCGAWVVPSDVQVDLMKGGAQAFGGEDGKALETFLAQGKRPVYVGWGSMIAVSPEHMACLAVRALMDLGERGIVLAGFAQLSPDMLDKQPDSAEMRSYAAENILFVKTAPHEMLFPRCAVVVHHGGSGTTMAALRSGVPSVVTPVFLDQFQNADLVASQGVGVKSKQFNKVTAQDLAGMVRRCLEEDLRNSAADLGARLRSEDGVATAVGVVRRLLDEDIPTGKYQKLLEEYKRKILHLNSRPAPSCITWLYKIFWAAHPNRCHDVSLPPEVSV